VRAIRLAIVTSHPIQYYSPLFRELSRRIGVHVFFSHKPTAHQQALAGYGVPFEWDVDLTSGLDHTFLPNVSADPSSGTFRGCDTPSVGDCLANGFDAVLVTGWNLKSYWQAILAARRLSLPVLVRGDSQLAAERLSFKDMVRKVLYPFMSGYFDAFLYTGQRNRAYLESYGANWKKLFFAPHCIDVDYFASRATIAARQQTRSDLGISDEEIVLLFAGRLLPFKRAGDLIAATARLRNAGMKVRVVVAGAGELSEQLLHQAQDLFVPLNMIGFCNQSRMPSVYAAADVLVLPSDRRETWGLVANEAIACGRPVVVSEDCGCAADLTGFGRAGAAFTTGDVAALAAAVEATLSSGPTAEDLSRMSALYSPAAAADGIVEAVEAVLARTWRPAA
jgi:glycosyltransferase involved in cell wall biosynthesis